MSRRTLIVSYDYKPEIGGQGVYVQNLERYVHNKALLVANGEPSENVFVKKTFFMKGLGPIIFSKRLACSLNKYVRKANADVVHFQSGPGGVFLLKKPRAKLFATVHSTFLLSAKHKKGLLSPYYKVMQFLERRSLKMCDHIIAISRLVKDEIVSGYKIDERKISVLHIPVEDYFQPVNVQKENIILFVGRLEKQKGILELLEAFRMVCRKHPEYSLEIAGEGSLSKKIRKIIRQNNLEGRIRILGPIKHQELPRLYSRAALTVMPSLFEPYGLTAIESISCGTPCLVPEKSGAAEIIEKIDKNLIIKKVSPDEIANAIEKNLGKRIYIDNKKISLKDWKTYAREFERIRDEL